MEYITSKSAELPKDKTNMENHDWFNMWKKRNFPYRELLIGDILYWYDTTTQKIVWKTEIIKVDRFPYSDKKEILDRYPNSMTDQYYESRAKSGYFVGYKVKVIEKLDLDKPNNFSFPQLGWLQVDNEISSTWLKKPLVEEINTLDDNISNDKKSIRELLIELNEKMKNVSPERVEKLISTTIRKDTKIIKALKEAANFKCQFPNCRQQIQKKNGGFYIEVAHIKPVFQNGQSVLGNLIVLCPNHHKEFDFGNLKILEQTDTKLLGNLNGKGFIIELIYHDH